MPLMLFREKQLKYLLSNVWSPCHLLSKSNLYMVTCISIFDIYISTNTGSYPLFLDIISYPDPQIFNGYISISYIQLPKWICYVVKISYIQILFWLYQNIQLAKWIYIHIIYPPFGYISYPVLQFDLICWLLLRFLIWKQYRLHGQVVLKKRSWLTSGHRHK